MDWEKLNLKEDTLDSQFWVQLFEEKPQALFDLLYDIYATRQGKLGRGRRKRMNGDLDTLWRLIYGDDGEY